MKVYKVISRIDSADAVFVPEGGAEHGSETVSLGSGKVVPIDSTGFVELDEKEAARLLASGAITSLDLEIAELEKKRDEALKTARLAEEALDERRKQLAKVIKHKRQAGVGAVEEKAVEQSKKEPVAAGNVKSERK